jgi:hypothetical protein
MNLPPGPLYLCRITLRNLPTSILWYGIFRLSVSYSEVATPTWLAIPVALSTQVVFRVAMARWRKYRNRRDAVVNGAVVVPDVQDGGLTIINAMSKSMTSGYPGGCFFN